MEAVFSADGTLLKKEVKMIMTKIK